MVRIFLAFISTSLLIASVSLHSAADCLKLTAKLPITALNPHTALKVNEYLLSTLASFEKMRGANGLVGDTILVRSEQGGGASVEMLNPNTSPTNIAVDLLIQTELAGDLKFRTLALQRMSRVVATLNKVSYHSDSGLFFSRYSTNRSSSVKDQAVSSIDNLHLALALWTIQKTFPNTRLAAESGRLFERMDFSVYVDKNSGLIGGNLKYKREGVWEREAYNFADLGSEARALYSAGWALGLFRDQSFSLDRAFSALHAEVYRSSTGDILKLWDGSAFQLYFPKIFLGEEIYSPKMKEMFKASGSRMITEGKRRGLLAPAAHSAGRAHLEGEVLLPGQKTYNDKAGDKALVSSQNNDLSETELNQNWDLVFAPYALFMAATSEPSKFIPVLSKLQSAQSGVDALYSPTMGWMDGLHVAGPLKGQVVPAQLSLNQGMIALSLLQMQAGDQVSASARALYNDVLVRERMQQFYDRLDERLNSF